MTTTTTTTASNGNSVATPTAPGACSSTSCARSSTTPTPSQVEVDESGRRPSLNVTVGPGDMGRVIGKRGRVAQSIRTVVRAAAARDGVEVDIEFLD